MPSLPPSEYIFKTDMIDETDVMNDISKGKKKKNYKINKK